MIYGGTAPTPSALFTYGSVNLSPAPAWPDGPDLRNLGDQHNARGTETGANTCAGASESNYKISYAVGNVMVSADNTTTRTFLGRGAGGQGELYGFTVAPATVTPSGSVTASDVLAIRAWLQTSGNAT